MRKMQAEFIDFYSQKVFLKFIIYLILINKNICVGQISSKN